MFRSASLECSCVDVAIPPCNRTIWLRLSVADVRNRAGVGRFKQFKLHLLALSLAHFTEVAAAYVPASTNIPYPRNENSASKNRFLRNFISSVWLHHGTALLINEILMPFEKRGPTTSDTRVNYGGLIDHINVLAHFPQKRFTRCNLTCVTRCQSAIGFEQPGFFIFMAAAD